MYMLLKDKFLIINKLHYACILIGSYFILPVLRCTDNVVIKNFPLSLTHNKHIRRHFFVLTTF